MLELTLELPAELASRKRTGKVWVYDRYKRVLAEGGFVMEPSSEWQTYHVTLANTGLDGRAALWRVWVESWGMKDYAPVNNALPVNKFVEVIIHFTVRYLTGK